MSLRQQSSSELVTAYGMVMLIVAVAIIIVLLLVSAPPAVIPKSCSIYGGLQCVDVAYGGNTVGGSILLVRASFAVPGVLNVSAFNAVAAGVKSTGGYCTTNGISSGSSTVNQGGSILCIAYFPTNSTISPYSGTFNVTANYCTGPSYSGCPQGSGYTFAGSWSAQGGGQITSNYITEVALNASTTTTARFVQHHVPITFTNSQSSATSSNFQEMTSFNPQTYGSYEASDLGNLRFYAGSTELYSWCESGCNTSTSTNAVFWILLPSGISASSNVVVNMTFLVTSTDYDGVYAGKCPTCTSIYAHYDNGNQVFTLYDNFVGTSLSSKWTPLGGASNTVNNGLTLTTTASTTFDIKSVSTFNTFSSVGDAYGYQGYNGNAQTFTLSMIDFESTSNHGYEITPTSSTQYSTTSWGISGGPVWHSTALATASQSSPSVWTISGTSSGATGCYNYNICSSDTTYPSATLTSAYLISGIRTAGAGTEFLQWIRVRNAPPGGVMPTSSYGPFT